MIEIFLTKGKSTMVDSEDYELVSQYNWYASESEKGRFYAKSYSNGKRLFLHRVLMNASKGYEVDHINRNTLDNRRKNLRVCTSSQNSQNISSHKDSTSQHKGVNWDASRKKWKSRIFVGQKEMFLGRFYYEHEAAQAYNEAAIKHFGEFACLNIIN